MKILEIIYADKKTRSNQRVMSIKCPQFDANNLSTSEMDFCDRIAETYRKINEVVMSWRIKNGD